MGHNHETEPTVDTQRDLIYTQLAEIAREQGWDGAYTIDPSGQTMGVGAGVVHFVELENLPNAE